MLSAHRRPSTIRERQHPICETITRSHEPLGQDQFGWAQSFPELISTARTENGVVTRPVRPHRDDVVRSPIS